MSDTNTADPFLDHLKARRAELAARLAALQERMAECDELLAVLADGRTRVRRRLRDAVTPGNGTAEQPSDTPP